MAKRKKSKKRQWKKQLSYELVGIFLLALASMTLAELGVVGQVLVHLFRFFLGEWHIVITIAIFITALYMMIKREVPPFWTRRLVGIYLIIYSFVLLSHVKLFQLLSVQGDSADASVIRNTWELYWLQVQGEIASSDLGGGMIGALGFALCYLLFDYVGTQIIAFVLIITAVILITGRSVTDMLIYGLSKVSHLFTRMLGKLKNDAIVFKNSWKEKVKERFEETKKTKSKPTVNQTNHTVIETEDEEESFEPIISDFTSNVYTKEEQLSLIEEKEEKVDEKQGSVEGKHQDDSHPENKPTPLMQPEVTNEHYQLPSIDVLKLPTSNGQQHMQQHVLAKSNIQKLEKTFESFGVKVKIPKVHLGPAVTKYDVYPSIGVKVSKIVNLADDLALALAAKDIRIEAPIPGKSAVGIEVPNQEVAIVTLREVLESKENKQDPSKLLIGLGRDISGEPVLTALNKMPHLLVAGATGSGKSVCINGIITSILMRAKPHEVKLMMIDPKMVELNVYNGIPHLLTPVVTEPKKASQALKKIVNEMERRYDLFSHTGTRNIEGYNALVDRENENNLEKQAKLPYIVVIVDELADLMMVASGDVEDSITRLAQMARAAGIHLIIATQRPSVDVITGVIKANIPSRIAFGVSSQTDSRTILDMGGAEKLLGRGDMLFLPVGASKPVRIQGAFLSDEEVEQIVSFVISQQKAQYQEEMTPTEEKQIDTEVKDELYQDAVDLIVEMNTASVSMLQRRFRIGYTRAARLIDEMEARGIVGPYEGSKPREVLISKQMEDASSS